MQLGNIKATINYLSFLKMLQTYGTLDIHEPRINIMIQMEQNSWLCLLKKWFLFLIENYVFHLFGLLIFFYFLCLRSYTGNWIDIEIIHLKILKLFMRSWEYNVSEPKLFPKWNEKIAAPERTKKKIHIRFLLSILKKLTDHVIYLHT